MSVVHYQRRYCPDCTRSTRFLWVGGALWLCETCSRKMEAPAPNRECAP